MRYNIIMVMPCNSAGCAFSKPETIAVVQFNNIAEIKMPVA